MKSKIKIAFFYLFPIFMFLQLGYGLIVREPYPSFMMPGFSRIDTNQDTYKLFNKKIILSFTNNETIEFDIKDLDLKFSKIAINRVIDLVYFNNVSEKKYNSAQKKYYNIIKSIIGESNYKKYILSVRYPEMKPNQQEEFKAWFKNVLKLKTSRKIETIQINRVETIRNFKSGEILTSKIIDYVEI